LQEKDQIEELQEKDQIEELQGKDQIKELQEKIPKEDEVKIVNTEYLSLEEELPKYEDYASDEPPKYDEYLSPNEADYISPNEGDYISPNEGDDKLSKKRDQPVHRALSQSDIKTIFDFFDDDQDGFIDQAQFVAALQKALTFVWSNIPSEQQIIRAQCYLSELENISLQQFNDWWIAYQITELKS